MNKKSIRDLLPLVAICLIAAMLLAVFNLITEGPIAENSARLAAETRTRLLSSAATFEPVELEEGSAMDSCYEGFDAEGSSVGYVVETTVGGYGGEIVVTVGMDADNVITGINVGGENFSETAGLGALAKEAAFTDQFIGKSVPLKLVKGNAPKGDDTIDAISGATITSTAVNGGVNLAGKFVMDMGGGAASPNTGSVQGFAGPVAVTMQLDDAGAITELTIGDAFFNETEGFGAKALEPDFQAQFIGKVPPLTLADIDAIAGATITSQAVVDAVNLVHAQLNGEAPVAAAPEAVEPVAAASDAALKGSSQGFAGPVAVAVDLDDQGAITAITIGDDSFAETVGFGAKALDDAFKAQFIGKVAPLTLEDVDAIAGATITSKAVIEALNQACGVTVPEAEEEPEAVPVSAPASENALTASVQGFAGPVAVSIELDANGAISAITIGDESFAETPGFGAKALEDEFKVQFIGKVPPLALADIDAISGATVTSQAVVDAINAAVPAKEEVEVEETSAALTASVQGFAGPVAVSVELDANGAISAITIGDDSFAETPGFGAKALEDDFKTQFIGKVPPLALADIDAIAGATVTSQAVVDAINAAVPAKEEAAAEETEALTASVQGFAGPVAVSVELDANGAISAITIGDDSFAETPGFGAKALEDEFKAQFIGKVPPLALTDIDAIAGATVTSQAVVDAINAAVPAKEEAAAEETAAEETTALTGSVQGFAGPVTVSVELDANGAISAITIGDESFAETPGFGAKALEDDFKAQFIGKVPPLTLIDIDAIAGATVTSQAVVDAINAAVPAKEEAAVEEAAAEETAALTASVKGFAGPVAVSVELDANGAISAITIGDDSFAETPGFGAKALEDEFKAQFIGKVPPLALADIDAIAGATVTSQAVVDALNAAVPAKEEATAEETAALTASVQGFAGPVAVSVELDANGAISAITIGDDSFAETPGFGAKALEDDFKAQFIGKVPPLALADIDAIAGATVTSQAVVDAINAAVPAKEEVEVEETSAALTASVQGFAGPVAVSVELDANGVISAIAIGDDSFAETPGFGAKALEDEFKAQFIGKVPPLALADIDAIAGATVTSQAVIDAINAAVPAKEEVEVEETSAALTASVQGFAGPVAVSVELDANGAISAINIGDESFAETPGFGAKALEDDFKAQFIGKVPPLALADIDAIAGATVTSQAVVDAINAAVAK